MNKLQITKLGGESASGLRIGETIHGLHVVRMAEVVELLGWDYDEAEVVWYTLPLQLQLVDHTDWLLLNKYSLWGFFTALRMEEGVSLIVDNGKREKRNAVYRAVYDATLADLTCPSCIVNLWYDEYEDYFPCMELREGTKELGALLVPTDSFKVANDCPLVERNKPIRPWEFSTLTDVVEGDGLSPAQKKLLKKWM